MNWQTRDATIEDAAYVFDNIWDSGKIELTGFNVSRDKWLDACIEMIVLNRCIVFEREGKVQALLGLNYASTWFQAVKDADMSGLTRQMRRAIPSLMDRVKDSKLSIYSLCVNSCSDKWFKLLGFVEDLNYRGQIYAGRAERRFIVAER